MSWFKNLKIAAKLVTSFVIVALIAGIVGIIGIVNIKEINRLDSQMYHNHTVTIGDLSKAIQYFELERILTRDLIMKDTSEQEQIISQLSEYDQIISDSMNGFEEGIISQEVRDTYNQFEQNMKNYIEYRSTLVSLIKDNKKDEAQRSIYGDGKIITENVETVADQLYNMKVSAAKSASDSNDKTANQAFFMMLIVIAVGMLFAVALGIIISRMISKPVNKLLDASNQLALGDVTVTVESDSKDEIGSLAKAFERMITNIRSQAKIVESIAEGDLTVSVEIRSEKDLLGIKLSELLSKNNEILNSIAVAAEQVAAGSKQVSDSSIALSQGAMEQASSIEELTASLEEIATQTKVNARNASEANELAELAKTNAASGNESMREMQNAMEAINISSTNISKIIKVIDEIAFQTNILSLNAAVEAARAGQHGKGFAVVADEVRNLAARSANAAKETTDMIEGSIQKVLAGTKIADQTAEALHKIVQDVEKVSNLVGEITDASNEQAAGIEQINQGVMQVSEVVQSNSATSEETAAASEELSTQADLLKESVNKFKLKKLNGSMDDLPSDVVSMLDNLYKKNSTSSYSNDGNGMRKNDYNTLCDKEFGKY